MAVKTRVILHDTSDGGASHYGSFTVGLKPVEVWEAIRELLKGHLAREKKSARRTPICARSERRAVVKGEASDV